MHARENWSANHLGSEVDCAAHVVVINGSKPPKDMCYYWSRDLVSPICNFFLWHYENLVSYKYCKKNEVIAFSPIEHKVRLSSAYPLLAYLLSEMDTFDQLILEKLCQLMNINLFLLYFYYCICCLFNIVFVSVVSSSRHKTLCYLYGKLRLTVLN